MYLCEESTRTAHDSVQRRKEEGEKGSKRYERGKGNERDYLHGVTGDYVCLSTKPPSAFVLFFLFLAVWAWQRKYKVCTSVARYITMQK